jgi:branched-chain amino acid transport system substrate-binding protein
MQKLVQKDKVFTVLEVSALFFGASPWATTAGRSTPVIGGAFDGSKDWQNTKNNLLPAGVVPNYAKTYSTIGEYFKSVGGTKIAGLAYENPASQAGLESGLKSAEALGLKRAYVNTTIPIGSLDVGAIVLGIIRSKADVLNLGINPDTALAVVAGLKQAGYKMKAILSATGYGADLLDAAPAVQIGQGVSFLTNWQPTELKTPATERMSRALKEHANSKSGIPSFSQAMGWLTADLFLHGLEAAGCNASQAKLLSTMRNDKSWDAGGLYPVKRDFTSATAEKLCIYFVRMKGAGFALEPKATPICGSAVS